MASTSRQRVAFYPKVDAVVLSSRHGPPPTYPTTPGPIYDPVNADRPIGPWPTDADKCFYPPQAEIHTSSPIPDRPACLTDRYLRASLAKNERLRLSMLWYYSRDILNETEFLCGLQEKLCIAQETTAWEFAIIGILDVNFYIRLATIGVPLGILPRGETICAHTVTQPPGSVFLLPNMLEDWRFQDSPYVESGGLQAYAGAPLRLQNEGDDSVCLGSLCVASATDKAPLTKLQQTTLVRLADWVVSDLVQSTRARRQRERRRMAELISEIKDETGGATSEESILRIAQTIYPEASIGLQSSQSIYIDAEDRKLIQLSDLEDGVWEDNAYIDDFIARSNHQELPSNRVVRVIAAPFEAISGPNFLVVATKDFRLVFDDVDYWFVQSCASMLSQMWNRRLLSEVMKAKEKFLRGFSHQLRTPIHGILGSAELMIEELKSLSKIRADASQSLTSTSTSASLEVTPALNSSEPFVYLDTIKRAGLDLISIVNSMITLNRWADVALTDREYAIHTVYDLEKELANETLKTVSGDTRYKASLFFNHDLPPDCHSFRIDLSLLRDSLLPLIINAIQNTAKGVVVVTISVNSASKELIVDVKDTGQGIPPEHQQRIFELYEKVDIYTTGAGLGLTLATKFAALLHGSITLISSEIGQGSHFRATFQDVDFAYTSLANQPLIAGIKSIPTCFHIMDSGLDVPPLHSHFARLLTCHGFTSSDTIADSLIILDYITDSNSRRACLSQIPPGQVAICLVPIMEEHEFVKEIYNNVVYLNSPFHTSTVISALEEVGTILSHMGAPQGALDQLDNQVPLDTVVDEVIENEQPTMTAHNTPLEVNLGGKSSLPDENLVAPADLSSLKSELAVVPIPDPVDACSEKIALLTCQPSTVNALQPEAIFPDRMSCTKPTALLVDDNAINLRIMQMYCNKRGLPYFCATDGQQAVDVFARHQSSYTSSNQSPIQLILMDLQMPILDGIEATQLIRALEKQHNWRESALFIVTGQDSPNDRKAADDAGAQEYLVKPVSVRNLDHNVKRHFPEFEPNNPR